ncbi:phosphate ABC transporter substrate-binding protein [Cellvibrio sp. KY-GH-1]|uniref:phosphate ABC transporter substrate-binding protein n=1 Tax=Cellvibrio sp. KY-GH-1 TaxID=2303332 RepID=UPI00124705C1|nr:phosphate ABC transporter substrate-binding protein [Cellvibrio sp. KY-GH-1]QEY16677.1 phosphate ABC transporter substrate-binding protein [Cellvibrio sp. KY-GH-1]
MKIIMKSLAAAVALGLSCLSMAEVAVIVHPSAGFSSLTEDDISRIFLGKSKSFPGGSQAVPVNQNEGSAAREKFNDAVCKKNASQYKAYWSQLVFTGKGTPPKDVGDDAAVKAQVAANPNAIGYVDASAVDASVKVVFKLP